MALCEICSYDFKGKLGLAVHKFRAHGIRRPGSKGKKYYDDHKDDPEYKVRNRANQRNYYHDHIEEPAFKDKWRRQWAKQSRRRWKDPNYRQQHSIRGKEHIRKVMADPVAHEHRKERCREYYKKEAKKLRASSLRYHRKWWGTFLAMYGNQCACCGETEKKFLTLDHINNDGTKSEKEQVAGAMPHIYGNTRVTTSTKSVIRFFVTTAIWVRTATKVSAHTKRMEHRNHEGSTVR